MGIREVMVEVRSCVTIMLLRRCILAEVGDEPVVVVEGLELGEVTIE